MRNISEYVKDAEHAIERGNESVRDSNDKLACFMEAQTWATLALVKAQMDSK